MINELFQLFIFNVENITIKTMTTIEMTTKSGYVLTHNVDITMCFVLTTLYLIVINLTYLFKIFLFLYKHCSYTLKCVIPFEIIRNNGIYYKGLQY